MRVFVTTPVATAESIMKEGWRDLHTPSVEGVHLSDRPLDERHGFAGPVTLCVDVPDDVFEKYECVEECAKYREHFPGDPLVGGIDDQPGAYRYTVIPADVLNQLKKPQFYDHAYAGLSRMQLAQAISRWEANGPHPEAQEMREAMKFFDRIGWQTLVRPRERPDE